ncbi:MAG: hypothetical protein ACRD01_05290 [Terriglobales bacterium]
MAAAEFSLLLRALTDGEVAFLLVGGLSAVLQGAPVDTFDVDIVHRRDPANVERLLRVLDSLDAIYRAEPERQLLPTAGHLLSPGHQNLLTRLGPLDVLGAIGDNQDYDNLLPSCDPMDLGPGLTVRVLRLDRYIAFKEALGGDKDRAVLPTLRQTLRERQARRR